MLSEKKCTPCQKGTPPLTGEELFELYTTLDAKEWELHNEHHLECTYTLPSFSKAIEFVQQVGAIAEEQGHHPLIMINFKQVTLTLWTHKIDGLCENDFILAAKYNTLYQEISK